MMWKKFTVSVFCLVSCCITFACVYIEPDIDELYMFKTYNLYHAYLCYDDCDDEFDDNVNFWYEYVDHKVGQSAIEDAIYHSSEADVTSDKYLFFKYLRQIGDKSAIRYWILTKRFSSRHEDPWYYPTKAEHLELKKNAEEIQMEANACTNPKLKERYVMQVMRICFYLKEYPLCIETWKNCDNKWQDVSMEKTCRSYYAGALYYTGNRIEAADIYAELGEWESLRYFGNRMDFMREMYEKRPSSKVFNYLIQEFENNYQDQRNLIYKNDFIGLCEQVLKEQRTDNPALWQSAMAHIAFLDGDLKKALQLIEKAATMKADIMAAENVRMLRLLYHAADGDAADYDANIATDLPWLLKKAYSENSLHDEQHCNSAHYYNMVRRTVLQYLMPHYSSKGNHNMAVAVLNALDEIECYHKPQRDILRNDKTTQGSFEYHTHFFSYLDTTSIDNVKNFLAFVKSGGSTKLEKGLIQAGYVRESMINELIGTKYMRLNDYENALQYFQKVSPSFWIKQNITEYLQRNPFMESWVRMGKERGIGSEQYNPAKLYAAQPTKMNFCLIMNELKKLAKTATNAEERAVYNYEYAVGLAQSFDWCWALTQYLKGSFWYELNFYQTDKDIMEEEWDYYKSSAYFQQIQYKELNSYLDKAEALTKDIELKARILYMRSSIELEPSFRSRYREQLVNDFTGTQFHQREMSHCDVLKMYR